MYSVSTPTSSNYGKHWSRERIREFVSPSSEIKTPVIEWIVATTNRFAATEVSMWHTHCTNMRRREQTEGTSTLNYYAST